MPALGPPDRVAGEGDHRHPLAVPDPFGRIASAVSVSSTVIRSGHRGQHPAALQGDQVLVLQLQPDEPAGVRAESLDDHRARGRSPCGVPLDVDDLPGDQPERADLGDQRGHRVGLRAPRPPRRSGSPARPSSGWCASRACAPSASTRWTTRRRRTRPRPPVPAAPSSARRWRGRRPGCRARRSSPPGSARSRPGAWRPAEPRGRRGPCRRRPPPAGRSGPPR